MKNLLLFYFLFFLFNIKGQEHHYPFFPNDQHCYIGGFKDFYKDFHNILIEKEMKSCENKKEFLMAYVLIKTDNTAEILENKSTTENKCSYDLTKNAFRYMDKWIPARIDGQSKATIARIPVYIDDLFDNYKEGYNVSDFVKKSDFDISKFRDDVVKRIDLSTFRITEGKEPLRIQTSFSINEKGELDDIKIIKSSGLKEFDEMILNAIKNTVKKKKWKPAAIHDIPIKSRFNLPFSING
ncbi:energy transducer TonB [Epilithonimonas sp.]|uniref:energy transducer TonB n=1 Tax=Epilithonimonas sp. TaxID=2894511 RepID=UPI0035B42FB0